jgi:membrane-associated phospholipid phosphatase
MDARRVIVVLAIAARSLAAQTEPAPLVPRGDVGVLALAGLGSWALTGVDVSIANRLREPSLHRGDLLPGVARGARLFGDPGSLVISAGLWGVGRLANDRTQERVGLRALESVVISGIIAGGLKGVTGRARPDTSPADARNFVLFRGVRGGSELQSFPSGHTTAAFAFAAAVDEEWARLNPGRPRWIGPALYGLATLTGLSRMYDDRHWSSDVLFGAAIGAITARAVVRYHADRP